MKKHTHYYALREALAAPGCPICQLVIQAMLRLADSVVYERANDGAVQQDVLRSRGWCNLHAWQLTDQIGGAFDVAILYRPTLRVLLQALRDYDAAMDGGDDARAFARLRSAFAAGDHAPADTLLSDLTPEALCPACQLRAQTERSYLQTLFEHIDDPEIAGPLARAGGLCWPHFRAAVELRPARGRLQSLSAIQTTATEQLLSGLEAFIRKHDYRFQDEPMGTEGDAWLRVIAQVSGARGVW